MKTRVILRSATLALLAGVLVFLGVGCGSDTNPDFQEPTADYHPFGAIDNHGQYLADHEYDFDQCKLCHGDNLRGEASGRAGSKVRSCVSAECHGPDNHPGRFTVAMQHPQYIESQHFATDECLACHVKVETSGDSESFGGSCSSTDCHTASVGGPDACNTCHGDFAGDATVPANWAPPRGIWATSADQPGIGAHQAHLLGNANFKAVTCDACHTVPSRVNEPFHIDTETPNAAELHFGSISRTKGAIPQYDADNATCSSVYCHGDATPVWTELDDVWNQCGSCHGIPPAAPHVQNTNCSTCHGEVVDANMNIINPELHVNGEVNVQLP